MKCNYCQQPLSDPRATKCCGSEECRKAYYREYQQARREKQSYAKRSGYECVCSQCAKKFKADRPQAEYCSRACELAGRRVAPRQIKCVVCERDFERQPGDPPNPKTCSAKCAEAARKARALRGNKQYRIAKKS